MILFRRVKENDLEFLYKLKKESMGDYIEQVWGWNPKLQRENIINRLKLKKDLIIIKSGKKIGYLSTFRTKKSITIVNLAILPKYQNKGIGTKIFKKIVAISIKKSKPLYFSVLKINVDARNLWLRLGGNIIGEDDTHLFMKYVPK
ncbi:MAG: GNAT family N-acetyltransferase, partial [Candidatus Hodarchaeota archaeon]